MRRFPAVPSFLFAALTGLAGPSSAGAQSSPTETPAVIFRFDPAYQAVVTARSDGGEAADDVEWARGRARTLTDFYAKSGPELLRLIAQYAGLRWPYADIDVYVVRDFPTLSIQYPLTLAVGSIRQGQASQKVPSDDFLVLTFTHQITHYLLDPPPEGVSASRPVFLESHPLMEESNYRREALVNLVAYRSLTDLWGAERLRKVVSNPIWESYNPEAAFLDSLQAEWTLSATRPLVGWLQSEPADGDLVRLAERLERGAGSGEAERGEAAPLTPGTLSGNEFGFDLGQSVDGRLFISFLDPRSPADTAGLHPGEAVLTIEGRSFDSVTEAMRAARQAWNANREVNLSVERAGKEVFFQIH